MILKVFMKLISISALAVGLHLISIYLWENLIKDKSFSWIFVAFYFFVIFVWEIIFSFLDFKTKNKKNKSNEIKLVMQSGNQPMYAEGNISVKNISILNTSFWKFFFNRC